MIGLHRAAFADVLHRMTGAQRTCFCPCSGRDVDLALTWLGSHFGHFVFCDSGYRRRDMTGRGAVPAGWYLTDPGPDRPHPAAQEPARLAARKVIERWRRPDGSVATLEFLSEPAEECLTTRFAAGTISALLHINDGMGEGGSNLWFLASPGGVYSEASRCLLPVVAERLTDEALVITDGALTDPQFARRQPFRRYGRYWAPLAPLENNRLLDRHVTVWRTKCERVV